MHSSHFRSLRRSCAALVAALSLLASSCTALHLAEEDDADETCAPHAKVCKRPTMHALACDLDHLEEHIDKYGSVVAKQPDVWGQARLTKYRDEFEKEMFKEFPNFKESLQGDISRSDQAYFADALAISAAISGQQAAAIPPPRVLVQNSTAQGTTAVTPSTIPVPEATPNTDVFTGFNSISRTGVRGPLNIGFATMANGGISLEPTIVLDQKARYLNYLDQIRRNNEGDDTADSPGYSLNLMRVPVSVLPGKCTLKGYGAEIAMTLTPYISDELLPTTFRQLVINDLVDLLTLPVAMLAQGAQAVQLPPAQAPGARTALALTAKDQRKARISNLLPEQVSSLSRGNTGTSVARQRVDDLPLAPTEVAPVLGTDQLKEIAAEVDGVVSEHQDAAQRLYLLDVRSALRDEITAAYDLLTHHEDLWTTFCTPDLARAIRTRQEILVCQLRSGFLKSATVQQALPNPQADCLKLTPNIVADLAWAIIVEAALLNERLNQDMHDAAAAKGCPPPHAGLLPFFLPSPPPDARQAFTEYVRCRWPIHVFALDPMTQDQNIAEAYSRRQEMQLALSLAFVSGNISARNMTRYARRLEEDMETISLNRTQVGFSHGDDTFGWRFYPRFQTPEFESNFTSLFRDQLIGGPSKNAEINQMRLEPGMRECVAIVMMPSFVPYVTCETSSNWFKLTNPKCKEFTTTDAIRLGRKLKSIYTCGPNVTNADCYRDGDLTRLMAKAKQLETRLPLQNMMVQVPYENTLGGFEMFNTGVTNLAPELRGWYGGPGVLVGADTQLILVGNHFSVHHTVVTAGGKDVTVELISRQIMRVTIPKGTTANTYAQPPAPGAGLIQEALAPDSALAAPSPSDGGTPGRPTPNYVDVFVATPYGVSNHLEIPQVAGDGGGSPSLPKSGLSYQDTVEVAYQYAVGGISATVPPQVRPLLMLQWDTAKLAPPAAYAPTAATCELQLTFANPYGTAKVPAAKPFDPTPVVVTGIPASFKAPSTASGSKTVYTLPVPNELLLPALMGRFGSFFGPKNINPPIPLQVTKATFAFKDANGLAVPLGSQPIPLSNVLTLTWEEVPPACPTSPAVCCPTLPPVAPCPPHAMMPPAVFAPPMPHPDPLNLEQLPKPKEVPNDMK